MIHRHFKDGDKLDVSGLNQITVLLDRSETELTEIGFNEWKPKLDGPPHKHLDKDQVFYIYSGAGIVKLGNDEHQVEHGKLIYVPAGLVHQTITTGDEPLCYVLYNIFNDSTKEGHSTFADHIEKVRLIRKQQADTGKADIDGLESDESTNSPKVIQNVYSGKEFDFGSNSTILLLDRNETNRFEFALVHWPAGNKGAIVAHHEKEQTFFVLKGEGEVTIGSETVEVKPGDLIYVPRNAPHTTESLTSDLTYLCLNSIVTDVKDKSFQEMYNRIAPGRKKRWEMGSDEIGE